MLSIPTLKVLRKWRDRAFLLRERTLDLALLRGSKRVLIWPWRELEEPIRRGFKWTRHSVDFAPVPPGGGDYDLVVPLSNECLIACAGDAELRARNPLPMPSPEVVNLCDDKAACNERLRDAGFGAHVPGPPAPGKFPYVLKLRRDSASRHTYRIDGPADEATHAERLQSPDYFQQRCVPGDVEFAAHLLHYDRRIQRALTMRFWLPGGYAIKGRDQTLLQRRCRNRRSHLELFERMLTAIGFEGLCCVNYKIERGVPQVFEINPRFGFSLGSFFPVFLRSLDWQRQPARTARSG